MPAEGILLNWKLSTSLIETEANQLIERSKYDYDRIGSLKEDEITYDTVVRPLCAIDVYYDTKRNMVDFPQHVSSDKSIREASTAADKKLSDYEVEVSMRQDIFNVVVQLNAKFGSELSGETKRFIEKTIKNGRRNGLHLSSEQQEEIKRIKKEMSELSIDFEKNLNEDTSFLEFTDEELAGVSRDFVDSLEKTESGKRKVTMQYPHYFPCMKKCSRHETRFELDKAFNSRCLKENTAILEKLIQLRHRRALILGFERHADFALELRMAKNATSVDEFLVDLAKKLDPLAEKEIAVMLKLKEDECKELNVPFDGKINSWDFRYFMNMVEEKNFSVDHEALKEYFPMEKVTRGLLDIYQTLLGLKFEHIPGEEVWHEDVSMYSVDDVKTGERLGYFYLDLFPREGKYGHAACFGLQPSCLRPDGKRQLSVAAMVGNFTKPTADKPALLMHDEVETYFHEFGHVMHQICAHTDFAMFSGTNVERDFVEAPSQMLENWVWEKDALRLMSEHYVTKEPIPDHLLDALVNSRKANAGLINLRQIVLSTFDQRVHCRPEADTAAEYARAATEILKISPIPGTNMAANFGHLAGGYDAQYYSYLWSEVFSSDMFHSRFKKEGVLNAHVGGDYRRFILHPGGSVDAAEMLRNFLGREPCNDSFLISKGIQV